ncbi:MAG TPA: cell envelope biogenesis protein TolA [Allosphingosinicella sp.]|jgi:outer membrane biosynthesis protein TonB
MDRAEATGLTVATAGHVALLAALSLGFAATRLPPPRSDPIEVSFVQEVAPESVAPAPGAEAPAPKLAEIEAPPEPAPAPPAPQPVAQPAPQPVAQPRAPAPAPVAARSAPPKPQPTPSRAAAPAVPKSNAARPTGRLFGLLTGLADRETQSRAAAPPAAKAGPAVEASLIAEVRRQLKPQWQKVVPTGADMESLRTEVSLTLAQDGRVTGVEIVGTKGITPSNRPQVALHQERAKKAVMLASPFRLPAEYYDSWKQLNVTLDLRLSQ